MTFPLSFSSCLELNRGTYTRESFDLPMGKGAAYVTTSFERGETDVLHYHDRAHLTFVLRGGVIDERRNSAVSKGAGELMFFHAGEPHQSVYTDFPTKNLTLELDHAFFEENSISQEVLETSAERDASVKFTMLKIFNELTVADDSADCSTELLLFGLLPDRNFGGKEDPVWVKKVFEILNDRWNESISLADLAMAAGVHPVTISKCFPKYFSCTFGEYRRRIKIERSLKLIKTSRLSLTEIAQECGFYDQSHFTRIFKQATGFLPGNYAGI